MDNIKQKIKPTMLDNVVNIILGYMIIFITGINSFIGKHLVDELSKRDINYYGIDTQGPFSDEVINLDI